MSKPVEIELKLGINPEDAPLLWQVPLLQGCKNERQELHSIYFDTPSHDLFRRRAALRLRRDGDRWIQTLKLDSGKAQGGLSHRPEYETEVEGKQLDCNALPDEARCGLIEDIEAALSPVFITEFERTTWLLETTQGVVEVALDLGQVQSGQRTVPLAEVELELKSGDAVLLFQVARKLLDIVPMQVEYRSKAMRGYGLAEVWQESPSKASKANVDDKLPAAESLRRSLNAAVSQLARNIPGLVRGEDIEYLHQARVAVRRMRTLIKLGKPLGLGHENWGAELAWLMSAFSPARDWDVLSVETLPMVRDHLPNPDSLDALCALAEAQRVEANAIASGAAVSTRLTALLLDMGAGLSRTVEPGSVPRTAQWANLVLDKRRRRFRNQAKHYARLDPQARHEVRLAGKRLRYACELFAPMYGAKGKRYLAQLSQLLDMLGAANDASVALGLLSSLDQGGRHGYALGLVEGVLSTHAKIKKSALENLVQQMVDAKPFWS